MVTIKKTKIIATIGPSSAPENILEELINLGVDGVRLNLSHGSHEEHSRVMRIIRKIEKKTGKHVAIIADTQGPKMRIGNLPENGLELKGGQEITLDTGTSEFYENRIPLPSLLFRDGTEEGHLVFLDDGALQIKIISKRAGIFKAVVLKGGMLFSKKGVNVPNLENHSYVLSVKDKFDISFALKSKVDYIALSFIRNQKDVKEAKKLFGKSKIRIIAKIERPEALLNIGEITDEADAIMIARGDLGIETPLWELPVRQKEIIDLARKKMKPVIVATQMLDSMIRNPIPTRAEVSDVANAVFDSTDAVMLSGETALGKYPVEAVDIMRRILESTDSYQDHIYENSLDHLGLPPNLSAARTAIHLAGEEKASVIILENAKENFVKAVSHFRLKTPIAAITKDRNIARCLSLIWGVTPFVSKNKNLPKNKKDFLASVIYLQKGDKIIRVKGKNSKADEETNIVSSETV